MRNWKRPSPGAFIPWATGPRNCPGVKFAQVEFVSVIASLLADSRVEGGYAASSPAGSGGGKRLG